MKNLLLLTFLLTATSLFAQKINWLSMDEALAAQKEKPKPIFIDMYTNWCGPCKMLDKNTFQNKDFATYVNENYYAVKFNAEGDEPVTYQGQTYANPNYNPAKASRRNSQHQLSRHFGIRAYPTVVFLDTNSDLLTAVKGYRTPQGLELYLKLFATGEFKNLKTQEAFSKYAASFVPVFKE